MICDCDDKTMPVIPEAGCPFEIGQIQRVIVGKMDVEVGGNDKPIDKGSTWASVSDTSVLPEVFAPVWTPGDEIVVGENSNETPNGAGIKVGEWGATLGGNFSQLDPSVLSEVKKLECRKGIGVVFVNQDGRIFGRSEGKNGALQPTDKMKMIPIARLSIKDYDGAGLDAATKNDFTIRFKQQWWRDLAWVDSEDILETI